MTSSDAYLVDVRRAMAGMDTSIRDDILRELQGHIAESAAANGGNLEVSLTSLGPAREVGRHYREVYGYGRGYQVLFAVVAFLLAVPSVPVLIVGTDFLFPFSLSLLFVVGAAMWILWVSVAAGSRAGMLAGVAGLAARLVAFIAVAAGQTAALTDAGGLGLLIAVSVLFVLLGAIPGTAKQLWSGPRNEL
jgi:hypothetical protein